MCPRVSEGRSELGAFSEVLPPQSHQSTLRNQDRRNAYRQFQTSP